MKAPKEVVVVNVEELRRASYAIAQHGGLLTAALKDLVKRRPATHAPSTKAVSDILDALAHVIQRDFRSDETRGTS